MSRILFVAPHADDETLGCGGTILRHTSEGDEVGWLLLTRLSQEGGFTETQIDRRKNEIEQVSNLFGFSQVFQLDFPSTRLDEFSLSELIQASGRAIAEFQPATIYLPFPGDAHSEHRRVFEAVMPSTKWFRNQQVRAVRLYETPSETEFGVDPTLLKWKPNLFMDISAFLEKKIEVMKIYASEIGKHPFPRSETSISSLARLRGSTVGVDAAEAFMSIRELL